VQYFVEQSISNSSLETDFAKVQKLLLAKKICKTVLVFCIVGFSVLLYLDPALAIFAALLGAVVWIPTCTCFVFLSRAAHRLTVCYDYFIRAEEFLIVKVLKRRKVILQVPLKKIVCIGMVGDTGYHNQKPHSKCLVAYCEQSKDKQTQASNLAYVVVDDEGQKKLLLWQPNQEILMTIKRSLPHLCATK